MASYVPSGHPAFAEMEFNPSIERALFSDLMLFESWKEQTASRFGGGTRAPSIPASQRQYDGENWGGAND